MGKALLALEKGSRRKSGLFNQRGWRGQSQSWGMRGVYPSPFSFPGGGCRGAKPPCQGVWGMCPQKNKLKGRGATSCHSPRSGTLNASEPQANEGGKRKDGGTSPTSPRQGDGVPLNPLFHGGGGQGPLLPRFFSSLPGVSPAVDGLQLPE